jgi:hypothetical protein
MLFARSRTMSKLEPTTGSVSALYLPVVLRSVPPGEVILMEKNRPVGVEFTCQFCCGRTRQGWRYFQLQVCTDCDHSPMRSLFQVSQLPHTRNLMEKEDMQ